MSGNHDRVIRAVKFHKEIRTGSSLPLLIGGDDANVYVVKLTGAGDGVISNVVEWLASKLGALLQIPVLQPVLVAIDSSFAHQAFDQETRELLEKSVGINLGTPYLRDASIYTERDAAGLNDFLQQQVFLFDLFLLNVDRTTINPNMIIHQSKLWCLDYSTSMEIRGLLTHEAYREHVLLRHLKNHPFYNHNLTPYNFIDELREIPEDGMRDIIASIPAEWFGNLNHTNPGYESIRALTEKLIQKARNGTTLHARLNLLRVLKPETQEEAELRTLANKRTFEQKHGKL